MGRGGRVDNQVWEYIPSRKYEKMKYLAHVVIYTEFFWKEKSQGGRSCMILQHFCTHSLHHHLYYFNYYHIFNVVFSQIELFGEISYKGYPFKSCNILFVAMIAINL